MVSRRGFWGDRLGFRSGRLILVLGRKGIGVGGWISVL